MKYFTVSYPDGTKHSWAYTLDEERVKLSGASILKFIFQN